MTRSELQDYSANEPVWRFIAQLARERYTGQADVGVETRVELYAAEGRVYFAQKTDDPPLGARLVSTGVLTTEQFRNGSVKVGDSVSLARLFQRVPGADRDTVELMTCKLAQQVLEAVSEHPVGEIALHPLRHHPAGIHQWFSDEGPATEGDEPSAAMTALVHDVVAAVSGQLPVVSTEPTVEPAIEPAVEPVVEPEAPPAPSMTFEVVEVALANTGETALPTLSSLQGLTPLPTLGAVGSRTPAPVIVHQPGPLDTTGLPMLGSVGTSFQPAPKSVEAPVAGTATEPAASAPITPLVLAPGSPLPPPPIPALPSPDSTAGAMMAPPGSANPESWEMVDDLLGIPHTDADAELVHAGGPHDDRKGRGWLRGRRG